MTNYKSSAEKATHSKLRNQRIQKGDGWTPLTFCGTGLSYSDSDSAGCDVFGRRMVTETTMNQRNHTTNSVIQSRIGVTPIWPTPENTTYSILYTLYSKSIIRNTEYYLSYYCMRVCSSEVVAA